MTENLPILDLMERLCRMAYAEQALDEPDWVKVALLGKGIWNTAADIQAGKKTNYWSDAIPSK